MAQRLWLLLSYRHGPVFSKGVAPFLHEQDRVLQILQFQIVFFLVYLLLPFFPSHHSRKRSRRPATGKPERKATVGCFVATLVRKSSKSSTYHPMSVENVLWLTLYDLAMSRTGARLSRRLTGAFKWCGVSLSSPTLPHRQTSRGPPLIRVRRFAPLTLPGSGTPRARSNWRPARTSARRKPGMGGLARFPGRSHRLPCKH